MAYNVPPVHLASKNRLIITAATITHFTWGQFLMLQAVSNQKAHSSGHVAGLGHNAAAFLLLGSTNIPEIHDHKALTNQKFIPTFPLSKLRVFFFFYNYFT